MQSLLECRRCPRLTAFHQEQRRRFPDYHNLPVPAFGRADAGLLIVGLAPGLHGANATGRPFTGDASGQLLFETLHRFGFANRPESLNRFDDMALNDCRITNAVKCLPPQNRPIGAEITACNGHLRTEIASLRAGSVLLALGAIAHRAIVSACELTQSKLPFAHLAEHDLPADLHLLDSYHCSRYNLNTGRLTPEMFDRVFEKIRQML